MNNSVGVKCKSIPNCLMGRCQGPSKFTWFVQLLICNIIHILLSVFDSLTFVQLCISSSPISISVHYAKSKNIWRWIKLNQISITRIWAGSKISLSWRRFGVIERDAYIGEECAEKIFSSHKSLTWRGSTVHSIIARESGNKGIASLTYLMTLIWLSS